MKQLETALQLKAELDKLRPIGKEQESIILQKFRLDWNFHSNHLEGNSLTFGETKALILFGITAQGKPLKDHFEITGHDEAIKWVTEIVKGDFPLTEKFIRELHTLLLKEPYEIDAITPDGLPTKKRVEVGKYKTTPNHVKTKTGEIFRFATPEETPALMYDLLKWYKEKRNSKEVNPIILAAEFHYRFIRIHPFDDGNGRVARILMNFILMQFGYPPAIIKTEDKINYFSALQQADSGSIEPFIDYLAQNLIRSLEIMIAGAKGKSIEEPDDLDKEIVLLEQKLNAVGKKIEIAKSKEAVLSIYDNSISDLCKKIIDACEKFDKFYIKNDFWVFVNNGSSSVSDKYTSFSVNRNNVVDTEVNNIKLTYQYKTFNRIGFGEFSFESVVEFTFGMTQYSVWYPGIQGKLMRQYGEQLTDSEIDEIVRYETKRHTQFIESQMKQVQNKKDNNK